MKKYAFTILLVAAWCIISFGALYPLPSQAAYNGTITDNFDGPFLNTHLWRPCDPPIQWVQEGGELRVKISPGGNECVQVEPRFRLRGNFEVTVDYHLITWPAANGARLGFEGPGFLGTDYAMCMLKRISHGADEQSNPGEEVFAATLKEGSDVTYHEVVTLNPTNERGSLKLTRADNRMTAFFLQNGGDWQEIASRDYAPEGLPKWYAVTLSVCGRPFTEVEVAFDNFQVFYDQVKFISDPSPLNLLLLE